MKLDEAVDAFACLRWDLRGLGGRAETRDEVELAAAHDLDHPGELDLTQLDGRTGERPYDGGGVSRIHEQPHPGQHVPYLRALQEGARRKLLSRRVAGWRGDASGGGHEPRIRASR